MSDLLLSHLFRDILISYCIFPVIPHLDIGIITVITIILCQLGLVIGGNGIVRNWPVYITLIQSEIQCVRTGRNTVRILIVNRITCQTLIPVTTTGCIGTRLLVPIILTVRVPPFIGFPTQCKTIRNTLQLHSTPFFKIQFASTFVSYITDIYRSVKL